RVSKKDILSYIQTRKNSSQQPAKNQAQAPTAAVVNNENTNKQVAVANDLQVATTTTYQGNVEIIEMDRMRKLIAKHMVDSQNTSAHVTSFAECDVTNLVLWREKIKKDFEKREGEKITYTPLLVEAIVQCKKKYPMLSSYV